jgi:NAD(P)-dependent dehydrogenase (short-subunit alcohol dehydrogenase family)
LAWTETNLAQGFLKTAFLSDPMYRWRENIEAFFYQARNFTDRLDALVNNAAIQVAKPLLDTSLEEWNIVLASNLSSVFLAVKLAHPLFKIAGGGAVVNVSSVHAIATSANIAAYAASRAGFWRSPGRWRSNLPRITFG